MLLTMKYQQYLQLFVFCITIVIGSVIHSYAQETTPQSSSDLPVIIEGSGLIFDIGEHSLTIDDSGYMFEKDTKVLNEYGYSMSKMKLERGMSVTYTYSYEPKKLLTVQKVTLENREAVGEPKQQNVSTQKGSSELINEDGVWRN